jgi:hypothetical protein
MCVCGGGGKGQRVVCEIWDPFAYDNLTKKV